MARLRLRSFGGWVIAYKGGGGEDVWANSDNPGDHEIFALNDANGGLLQDGDEVAFRCFDGTHFLGAKDGGNEIITARPTSIGEWEWFRVRSLGGPVIDPGTPFGLQVAGGQFAGMGANGRLEAYAGAIGGWETFRAEPLPNLPLSAQRRSRIGRGKWMESWVTVGAGGNATIETHTWTRNEWYGFTGGVLVVFLDNGANLLDRVAYSYGVDGTWVVGSRSSRSDIEGHALSPAAQQAVSAVWIRHYHDPRNRLKPIVDGVAAAAKTVYELLTILTTEGPKEGVFPGAPAPRY